MLYSFLVIYLLKAIVVNSLNIAVTLSRSTRSNKVRCTCAYMDIVQTLSFFHKGCIIKDAHSDLNCCIPSIKKGEGLLRY